MKKKIMVVLIAFFVLATTLVSASPPLCPDEPLGCPGFLVEEVCGGGIADAWWETCASCDNTQYIARSAYDGLVCDVCDTTWPQSSDHEHANWHTCSLGLKIVCKYR